MDPNVGEADREGPNVGEAEFIQLENFLPQTVKLKNPTSDKKPWVISYITIVPSLVYGRRW